MLIGNDVCDCVIVSTQRKPTKTNKGHLLLIPNLYTMFEDPAGQQHYSVIAPTSFSLQTYRLSFWDDFCFFFL